ncbi:uncharacterized protein J3R85_002083 [Psidium guajava]|nr:uncharacterized protein J3R85_002083 [Psidium guajava]
MSNEPSVMKSCINGNASKFLNSSCSAIPMNGNGVHC